MEYTEHEDTVVHFSTENHYELHAKGLLKFRDLNTALTSLQKIDALYRKYREVSDRVGTGLAREIIARGERRARRMAADPRLRPENRREKEEIAQWFRVWLEVPDLFPDWLEMRQETREFREHFPHMNGRYAHHARKRTVSV